MNNSNDQPSQATTIHKNDQLPCHHEEDEESGDREGIIQPNDRNYIGASTSTVAAAATAAANNTRRKQSHFIEEFASSNNLGFANTTAPRPPTSSTNVPPQITTISDDGDDQSNASSITLMAAFQNADLYVPSLYPSTRVLEEEEEEEEAAAVVVPSTTTSHTAEHAVVGVASDNHNKEEGVQHPPTSVSSSAFPAATATLAAAAAAAAAENKRKKPYYSKEEPGQSVQSPTHASQNEFDPEGLEELGQIELSVLKLEQQNTDGHSITPQIEEDALLGIMPLPNEEGTTREQQPRGPGAHAISTSVGWNPFGGQSLGTEDTKEDSKEESKRDTNFFNNNANLGLAEAQPANALPIAEVDEEWGDQQQKPQRHISFFGFLTGLPRPCRYLLMAVSAAIMAKWFAYIIRSLVEMQDPATARIRQSIEESFGKNYFDSELKERALHWIVHEDPLQDLAVKEGGLQEGAKTTHLIQRFSLVAFYFQTSTRQPWSYCNPPQGKQSDVCFYHDILATTSPTLDRATRWLSAAHECQWMGVYCDKGSKSVSTLRLRNNNMTGEIPSELAKLDKIRSLILPQNDLSGSLPSELSTLSNMEGLELSQNNLSGSLPLWTKQLTSLQRLHLDENSLTGGIPPEIFSIPSLSDLYLNSNLLDGPVPSQIGLFGGQSIFLDHNSLSGPIPNETYQVSNLQWIYLGQNSFTGTISTLVGQLTKIQDLYLNNNHLEGTVPEELFSLESLLRLDISDNQLGGTISSRIGQLGGLEVFSLSNAGISGTMPEQISSLSKLRTFHANGNPGLYGSMPTKFCTNRLQHNDIVVDCSPAASTGVPAVTCPKGCCSACCDAETKICSEQRSM